MPYQELNLNINHLNTRKSIRDYLITEFLKETPGTGTGELASRYRYNVEQLSNGHIIYLSRPAILNNGMDFVIRVDGLKFQSNPDQKGRIKNFTSPAHYHIINDLKLKKEENINLYNNLIQEIEKIFNIQSYNIQSYNIQNLTFQTGIPVETLLAIIKWFFIEQDVTYWNFSGRNMLMSRIKKV